MSVGLFVSVTRSSSLIIVALKKMGQNLLIEGVFKKMPKLFSLFLKRFPQQIDGKYHLFLNAIQYILITYPVSAVNQIVFVSRWLYLLQSLSAIFLARQLMRSVTRQYLPMRCRSRLDPQFFAHP